MWQDSKIRGLSGIHQYWLQERIFLQQMRKEIYQGGIVMKKIRKCDANECGDKAVGNTDKLSPVVLCYDHREFLKRPLDWGIIEQRNKELI